MAYKIREARSDDVDQLVQLWKELAEYHSALDPRYAVAENAEVYFRAGISSWVRDDGWRILVAEENGNLVGFASATLRDVPPVFPERQHGYISDAIVKASFRRQGIGEQLCKGLLAWFKSREITVVELNAAAVSLVSRNFWRKMGFLDFSVIMRKDLE